MEEGLTNDLLMQWLNERIKMSDVKMAGFEIEYVSSLAVGGGVADDTVFYKIKDTNIQLMFISYDPIEGEGNVFSGGESASFESDYALAGVIAPAEIACPLRIGNPSEAFFQEGVVYLPNVTQFGNEGGGRCSCIQVQSRKNIMIICN